MKEMDDKIAVIFCVTVVLIFAMFTVEDPVGTINQGLTGLMGIAVGRALPK